MRNLKKSLVSLVIGMAVVCTAAGCGQKTEESSLQTVSYTHLDVYKRQ